MITIVEGRASYILFNVVRSAVRQGTWIIPSNSCGVVPATFYKAGVPFESCDLCRRNLCMDLQEVSDRISREPSKYAGVLFVYTYGAEANVQRELDDLKEAYPFLLIVEDRCLCRPQLELTPGVSSDVTLFSTGYAKYVDFGMGGYALAFGPLAYERHPVIFKAEAYADLDIAIKEAISKKRMMPPSEFVGNWLTNEHNIKDPPAYLGELLFLAQDANRTKQAINEVYQQIIPEECAMPERFNQWRFNLLVNDSQKLLDRIFDSGLFASKHYCPIEHYTPLPPSSFGTSDWLYKNVINLFNDKYYSLEQAELTANIVKEHVERHGVPKFPNWRPS